MEPLGRAGSHEDGPREDAVLMHLNREIRLGAASPWGLQTPNTTSLGTLLAGKWPQAQGGVGSQKCTFPTPLRSRRPEILAPMERRPAAETPGKARKLSRPHLRPWFPRISVGFPGFHFPVISPRPTPPHKK